MHPNQVLLNRFFERLNAHDAKGMAECYEENATFEDIAFRLKGRDQIHAMWDYIFSSNGSGVKSDLVATVKNLSVNNESGRAVIVDHYTFRDTKHKVHNHITSTFRLQNGKILDQVDKCDPISWAKQALGPVRGFLAGRFSFLRRYEAKKKLKAAYPKVSWNR